MSFTNVALNAFNSVYPNDGALLPVNKMASVLITGVKSANGAVAQIVLFYPGGDFKSYSIRDMVNIPLELSCIGFNFIAPRINIGQEITFKFNYVP